MYTNTEEVYSKTSDVHLNPISPSLYADKHFTLKKDRLIYLIPIINYPVSYILKVKDVNL